MDGSYRALTLALAVSFCGDWGRTVHPKLHIGAVTGATRTCEATPECNALKMTPVVGAPRHDRVSGRKPSGESLYALDL
jgi:hypothetical protein